MLIAAWITAGLGVLLVAHVTILPLIHGRAILLHGTECVTATVTLIASGSLFASDAAGAGLVAAAAWMAVPVVAVLVARMLVRPWLVVGAPVSAVIEAAQRAASMVRARCELQGATTIVIAGAARVRVVRLFAGVSVVLLSGRVTPKVALWRNLYRKTIQNHSWRVA